VCMGVIERERERGRERPMERLLRIYGCNMWIYGHMREALSRTREALRGWVICECNICMYAHTREALRGCVIYGCNISM